MKASKPTYHGRQRDWVNEQIKEDFVAKYRPGFSDYEMVWVKNPRQKIRSDTRISLPYLAVRAFKRNGKTEIHNHAFSVFGQTEYPTFEDVRGFFKQFLSRKDSHFVVIKTDSKYGASSYCFVSIPKDWKKHYLENKENINHLFEVAEKESKGLDSGQKEYKVKELIANLGWKMRLIQKHKLAKYATKHMQ